MPQNSLKYHKSSLEVDNIEMKSHKQSNNKSSLEVDKSMRTQYYTNQNIKQKKGKETKYLNIYKKLTKHQKPALLNLKLT